MFCVKCGNDIGNNASFCPICGANNAHQPNNGQYNGGAQVNYNQQYNNGQNNTQYNGQYNGQNNNQYNGQCNTYNSVQYSNVKANKSIPAFVVGLIGAIFALFGGLCVAACYSISGNDTLPLVLMVGGSIVGLIGACLCFGKAIIGSALEIIAAIMILICITVTGADFASIIGMILLAVGGIIGLITQMVSK